MAFAEPLPPRSELFHGAWKPNLFFKSANLLFRFLRSDAQPVLQSHGKDFSIGVTCFNILDRKLAPKGLDQGPEMSPMILNFNPVHIDLSASTSERRIDILGLQRQMFLRGNPDDKATEDIWPKRKMPRAGDTSILRRNHLAMEEANHFMHQALLV